MDEKIAQYQRDGYVIVSDLFSPEEVAKFREHYTTLREQGEVPGDNVKVDPNSSDPLKRYPRMMQPHRWDPLSLEWLIDQRLNRWLTAFLGSEPYAVQTMVYFKPAGARGQALHQDQYYVRVQPGTCMAAWMALDDCDEENGCLQVVPGTQNIPVLCTVQADTNQSFTDVTVPLPEGMAPVPVVMAAGDVLFFNGQLIHGSFPNSSKDRFRRTLIGHYVVGEAKKVSQYYHPALRMDGSVATLDFSEGGSECGVWVEQDGMPVVELQQQ